MSVQSTRVEQAPEAIPPHARPARRRPSRRHAAACGLVALAAATALSGCAKSASSTASSGSSSSSGSASSSDSAQASAAAQQTQAPTTSAAAGSGCTATKYGAPALTLKGATVGFSQSESTSNPFRATETSSITAQAKAVGVNLIQRNANGDVSAQNSQIEDMIAQGAKALVVAPENSDGLAPALAQAKAKHIPVLTIDRTVTGTACSDYISFIGSDFTGQAKIAADDLGQALGGKGTVVMLLGTSGNNVTTERTNGFTAEVAAKYPGIKVAAKQTADFDQTKGQNVMAQLLQSNPGITGVYAENDEMALGALQAIRAAGKTPGKDVKIVSIDGIQQAVQDVASGTIVADVETNPRFGPLAFSDLTDFYSGTGVQPTTIIKDNHFTSGNAKQALANGDVY